MFYLLFLLARGLFLALSSTVGLVLSPNPAVDIAQFPGRTGGLYLQVLSHRPIVSLIVYWQTFVWSKDVGPTDIVPPVFRLAEKNSEHPIFCVSSFHRSTANERKNDCNLSIFSSTFNILSSHRCRKSSKTKVLVLDEVPSKCPILCAKIIVLFSFTIDIYHQYILPKVNPMTSSVTSRLECLFNILPLKIMEIRPITCKICQIYLKIIPSTS